jgi:hypothetical protein
MVHRVVARGIVSLYLHRVELQLLLDLSRCGGLIPVALLLSSNTADATGKLTALSG